MSNANSALWLIHLSTLSYFKLYFSVDILSSPGHSTPVFPSIRTTQIRDGRCGDSYRFVILDGVSALFCFCRRNKNIVTATVILAQVLLVSFISLSIGTRNINFSPFISRHSDQLRCTRHTDQSICNQKTICK